jgi:hypothetical protein
MLGRSSEGYFEQLARLLHPCRFGEKYYAMMFGCYLDESFDMKQSGFYAVGGFIARGVAMFELERQWEKLLKRRRLKYFKASECESGKKQFAKFVFDSSKITAAERAGLDSISHEFCKIIGNPVEYDNRNFLSLFGSAVVQKDFYDLIKNPKAKAVLGSNPYRLAYDLAMVQAAWAMKQLEKYTKRTDCVSYVCDQDEEHSESAPIAYLDLVRRNPKAAKYMCSYSMADEKKCAPLQAADAVVYEIRKVIKFAAKDWETKLRAQFGFFADNRIMFYVGHSNREQLEWIVANHKPGQTFKLDKLMQYRIKENLDKLRI